MKYKGMQERKSNIPPPMGGDRELSSLHPIKGIVSM